MGYIELGQKYLKFKKTGKNYFALCPFHEEKTPSFQLNADSGLWHCWGCGAAGNIWQLIIRMESVSFPESVEIAKQYGIEPPENFIERNVRVADNLPSSQIIETETEEHPVRIADETTGEQVMEYEDGLESQIIESLDDVRIADNIKKKPVKTDKETEKKVATYIYEDQDGKILFEKERWEKFNANNEKVSKRFIFYHYVGAKRIVGKGDSKQILYNLRDVIGSKTVFICEGEKDADNLKSVWQEKNCAFTTNAAGAEHWDESFNAFLKGKDIIVLEDNDDAGRKRTALLERQLKQIGNSFKVIRFDELEEHGDVSDYLERFGISELEDKIAKEEKTKAADTTLAVLDVFDLRFYKDENEYILSNFLPLKKGKTNTVSGAGIEFFIFISLILSKKYEVAFLSGYGLEELKPYFKNVILRIDKDNRKDVKNISIGETGAVINDAEKDIVVSTEYVGYKGITTICPAKEKSLPDFYFKNGDVYDKFWKKVLRIENLKGAGEIKISKPENKENKSSLLDIVFKKTKK